jgi:Pyruvate/2-oxoacid:ferredoxin oxidoreductase gamma subunit
MRSWNNVPETRPEPSNAGGDRVTERALLLTGIGGQGIQLATRTLAVAAVEEHLQAMMFGQYGGSMRGGNSDATLVLGTERLLTPPTVSRAWAAITLHHQYWPDAQARLEPGGVVVVDRSVFRGEIERVDLIVVDVEATGIATDMGNQRAASMVALGAFAAATGIVGLAALEAATAMVLPSYRAEHAAANADAIRAGHGLVADCVAPAWPERTVGVAR